MTFDVLPPMRFGGGPYRFAEFERLHAFAAIVFFDQPGTGVQIDNNAIGLLDQR